ncbi:uncharacterized protein DDB_G0283357-like [Zeugodacus cucurbitae]|uniref:uncharacterized protein DDB_G0283357-like n=1 Tax=Zeugodacus cucurbitae TaxID=28588 RepID=UPI0005969A7A|nr:uncharacterized protein DDB_G0283357-like [Zeugodacus cucurbitae]
MMTNNNTTNNSNKMSNGKAPPPPPHAHALSSLPRFGSARREAKPNERAESTLSHEPPYSQHLANQNGQRAATADRYLRLTQDHFNHNHGPYGSIGSNKHANTLSGERSPRESECNYIHNNSHYSLPLDHALSAVTPTPTPPPPALPVRNGQLMHNGNSNGGQRVQAYNNNNCSNGYATIGGGNHFGGGVAIGVGGNNNNGSLRRYH